MNRYLLRSIVAVLTFSIGVAVGSFAHRHTRTSWQYKRHACDHREYKVHTVVLGQADRKPWVGPSISVDSSAIDPLKLTYSSTTPLANDLARQRVEFGIENNTNRAIARFTVAYRSRWRSTSQGGAGAVAVDAKGDFTAGNAVSIECSGDENLSIWVASVEFKDGSRWNNKRHSN